MYFILATCDINKDLFQMMKCYNSEFWDAVNLELFIHNLFILTPSWSISNYRFHFFVTNSTGILSNK